MTDTERDNRLAAMAAKFLNVVMLHAEASSPRADVESALHMHDAGALYPKLTITSPHGGGALRLELVLCDPSSDEPVVMMFCGEANATMPGDMH